MVESKHGEDIRDQTDSDGDSVGDVCDNCKLVPNPYQKSTDGDETGDVCEKDDDIDGDGEWFLMITWW